MKKYLWLAGFLALAGCNATMPVERRPTSADDPTQRCFETSYLDPRLQVLIPKVGALGNPNSTGIDLLVDKSKPTDDERVALKIWADVRPFCLEQGAAFRSRFAPPGFDSSLRSAQTNLILLTAQLYAGEINYGQFNTERRKLAEANRATLSTISNQQAEREAQESERRRALAAQLFMHQQQAQQKQQEQQQKQQQELLQRIQQNRPTYTTCDRLGNSVNCVTR